MEFGRLSQKELDTIKVSLPGDPLFNKSMLKGKSSKYQKVYIGCAKWGRKEWVGKLYPVKTKEKDFLDNYVNHYNSIELNATHYKIYKESLLKKWAEKADNKDFIFAPKMYKGISHFGNLAGKQRMTTDFLNGLQAFGKHLGPVFIQMSERFSVKRKDELFEYLELLPKDLQFFLEVRDPSWYADKGVKEELFKKLKKLKIGAVITDTVGRRDCVHMYLTVQKVFIRFVGNSLHKTDYKRIDDWVKRIGMWLNCGIKEIYFFMHMHDEAFSPELSLYLVRKLNREYKLKIPEPVFQK